MEGKDVPRPYQSEQEAGNMANSIQKDFLPHIGKKVAVIGCGNGFETHYLIEEVSSIDDNVEVLGYDYDSKKISINKDIFGDFKNHNFSDSLEDVKKLNPDTIVSFFAVHHDPSILKTAFGLLTKGKLIFVDYSLKGINQDEFKKVFNSPSELKEIEELGLEETYKLHTRFDLTDYKNMIQDVGFKLIENKKFTDNSKFEFFVCQKQ